MLPLLLLLATSALAQQCPPDVTSCSKEAAGVHGCCVASAGVLVLRQRFEPDVGGDAGSWGIDSVEVLECDGSPAQTEHGHKRTHEEIGSICLNSPLIDSDRAEHAWAQDEVGEGVEEVWERTWNSAGRYLSTICDGDVAVARFFAALQTLHGGLPTAELLANVDITPSEDTTYSLADIEAALTIDGFQPVVSCAGEQGDQLSTVDWPVHIKGKTEAFAATKLKRTSNCPSQGIHYPPSANRPKPTATTTWDQIHRPSMRPITLSADEAKQVQYPEDDAVPQPKRKLGFFKGNDARRAGKEHGHDEYARRDEL